jgi:hypothetical protein
MVTRENVISEICACPKNIEATLYRLHNKKAIGFDEYDKNTISSLGKSLMVKYKACTQSGGSVKDKQGTFLSEDQRKLFVEMLNNVVSKDYYADLIWELTPDVYKEGLDG